MALDPEDPLIPLPWQMENIRAYRSQRASESEKKQLELEKLRLDLAERRKEQEMASPSGRAAMAADVAAFLEQEKQKEFGVPIGGEVGAMTTRAGGPSLLEATRMQGEMDVEARVRDARRQAMMNFAAGEKSLLPTAKIDIGGVSATVPFESVGEKMSQAYKQKYRGLVPVIAEKNMAEGYDRDSAIRKASEDVGNSLIKKNLNGEIPIYAIDGVTVMKFMPEKEAEEKWQDPKTPQFIRNQLEQYFGPAGQSSAQNWVKSRIGR